MVKISRLNFCVTAFFCLFAAVAVQAELKFSIVPAPLGGICKSGEPAKISCFLTNSGQAVAGRKIRCSWFKNGKPFEVCEFTTSDKPVELTSSMAAPGWLYAAFSLLDERGNVVTNALKKTPQHKKTLIGECGFMYSPEALTAVAPEPVDFDAFWRVRRSALDRVPVNAEVVPVELSLAERKKYKGVQLYTIAVDCVNSPVTGYLAVPSAAGRKFPAAVYFQSAVIADANRTRALKFAAMGALGVATNVRALPVGRDKAFYDKAKKQRWPNVQYAEDPNKWFIADVAFRVMRSLDYVKSRPDWDGEHLVVNGGSLGGGQTIIAAALDPAVTLAVPDVPALCDHGGRAFGRAPGWPRLSTALAGKDNLEGALKNAAYFDGVNFARRIKCPVYTATGFADEVCSPSSVYVFFNSLPENLEKHITTNPLTGHFGTTKNTNGEAKIIEYLRKVSNGGK